ncbi:outer membrane beta-barrel protein [Algibacter marinivivus]|nr:outer membrane beta-barrel protein [Algibacter marinivivus]
MKNFITLISFCFAAILLSSCAALGFGYVGNSDVFDYPRSSSTSVVASKSATAAKSEAVTTSNLNNSKNRTNRSGFYLGVFFTDINLSEKFELQPELNFLAIKDDLNQLQAPILAKYEVADKLNLVAGPNLGFLLDAPDGIKSFNIGFDLGATYDITEKILVSARYNKGLSNLQENSVGGSSVKLNNIQIGVGYKFN